MSRRLTLRIRAASTALVFAATGGLTGMEAHPLSMHGPHVDDLVALELGGATDASAPFHQRHHRPTGHAAHHADRHGGDPGQAPTTDCTCVGLCQGGVTPSMSIDREAAIGLEGGNVVRVIATTAHLLPYDPTSYLLPLPNPPPAGA